MDTLSSAPGVALAGLFPDSRKQIWGPELGYFSKRRRMLLFAAAAKKKKKKKDKDLDKFEGTWEPKEVILDQLDVMYLRTRKMVGETTDEALAKVVAKKLIPGANFLDVEKIVKQKGLEFFLKLIDLDKQGPQLGDSPTPGGGEHGQEEHAELLELEDPVVALAPKPGTRPPARVGYQAFEWPEEADKVIADRQKYSRQTVVLAPKPGTLSRAPLDASKPADARLVVVEKPVSKKEPDPPPPPKPLPQLHLRPVLVTQEPDKQQLAPSNPLTTKSEMRPVSSEEAQEEKGAEEIRLASPVVKPQVWLGAKFIKGEKLEKPKPLPSLNMRPAMRSPQEQTTTQPEELKDTASSSTSQMVPEGSLKPTGELPELSNDLSVPKEEATPTAQEGEETPLASPLSTQPEMQLQEKKPRREQKSKELLVPTLSSKPQVRPPEPVTTSTQEPGKELKNLPLVTVNTETPAEQVRNRPEEEIGHHSKDPSLTSRTKMREVESSKAGGREKPLAVPNLSTRPQSSIHGADLEQVTSKRRDAHDSTDFALPNSIHPEGEQKSENLLLSGKPGEMARLRKDSPLPDLTLAATKLAQTEELEGPSIPNDLAGGMKPLVDLTSSLFELVSTSRQEATAKELPVPSLVMRPNMQLSKGESKSGRSGEAESLDLAITKPADPSSELPKREESINILEPVSTTSKLNLTTGGRIYSKDLPVPSLNGKPELNSRKPVPAEQEESKELPLPTLNLRPEMHLSSPAASGPVTTEQKLPDAPLPSLNLRPEVRLNSPPLTEEQRKPAKRPLPSLSLRPEPVTCQEGAKLLEGSDATFEQIGLRKIQHADDAKWASMAQAGVLGSLVNDAAITSRRAHAAGGAAAQAHATGFRGQDYNLEKLVHDQPLSTPQASSQVKVDLDDEQAVSYPENAGCRMVAAEGSSEGEVPGLHHHEQVLKDWALAEIALQTRDIQEVVFVGRNTGGMLVKFGSLTGFLPGKELDESRNLTSFRSWAREKGYYVNHPSALDSSEIADSTFATALVSDQGLTQTKDTQLLHPTCELELHKTYAEERLSLLSSFVGQKSKVRVIFVDKKARRLVVSEKKALNDPADIAQRRTDLLAKLQPGEIVKARVRNISIFGVFVELAQGVTGLIRFGELSWTRAADPSTLVKIGEEIEVMVHRLDHERQQIDLSLKRMSPDPLLQAVENLFSTEEDVNVNSDVKAPAIPELEGLIERLEKRPEIDKVVRGKRVRSPGVVPNFQVYLSSAVPDGFKVMARIGNEAQEILLQTSLEREAVRDILFETATSTEL